MNGAERGQPLSQNIIVPKGASSCPMRAGSAAVMACILALPFEDIK